LEIEDQPVGRQFPEIVQTGSLGTAGGHAFLSPANPIPPLLPQVAALHRRELLGRGRRPARQPSPVITLPFAEGTPNRTSRPRTAFTNGCSTSLAVILTSSLDPGKPSADREHVITGLIQISGILVPGIGHGPPALRRLWPLHLVNVKGFGSLSAF